MQAMPESTPVTQRVIDRLRREAVVIAPFVYAVIVAVPEHTALLDWKVWGPVAIGVVLRQFFTSPTHEVEAREEVAYRQGLMLAPVIARAKQAVRDTEAELHPEG
jgi:hypothetical protein